MLDFNTDTAALPLLAAYDTALLASLVADQVLSPVDADRATSSALRLGLPLADVLLRQCNLPADIVARHQAKAYDTQAIDPTRQPPDATLVDRLGARTYLRLGVLPWRQRRKPAFRIKTVAGRGTLGGCPASPDCWRFFC